MKIFLIVDPKDYSFAIAGRRGTWSTFPKKGFCPECKRPLQERIAPLIIEWMSGSDVIGDFTFPGFADEVVVHDRVRDVLGHQGWNVDFMPVEMVQAPRLKRPARQNKRTKPRVWLPYEGPPLWDLQPQGFCSLDLGRSGLMLERVCGICKDLIYRRPPLEGRHLVIPRSEWREYHIFQITEYAGLVYCTEYAKKIIEKQGFTNVAFELHGEIEE